MASGAIFIARNFSSDPERLKTMKAAIAHKGYTLVDILKEDMIPAELEVMEQDRIARLRVFI